MKNKIIATLLIIFLWTPMLGAILGAPESFTPVIVLCTFLGSFFIAPVAAIRLLRK